MRSVALCLLFVAACQSATRNVTVLVNFEKPHSDVSVMAMRHELRELLEPAGISVEVMLKTEMPASPQFSELFVFAMKGWCSMNAMPAISNVRGPLGLAFSSNGEILHFGEVECDRVRQCLQRVVGSGRPQDHQAEFGAALGIVVAHEIYHMIVGAKEHTKDGLTKESLSAHELLDGELYLPATVREALMREFASNHP